jgi:hypothetical protein
MSDAYDKIDHYLRNNLDDTDYTEYSTALDEVYAEEPNGQTMRDLLMVAEHMQLWIKAVPEDTPLPAMPGLCGDFIQGTLERARKVLLAVPSPEDCQSCNGTGSGGMGSGCTDCNGTGIDPRSMLK